MTLQTYNPEKLEGLAFRLFDIAAQLREMAKESRAKNFVEFPINDRKAIQWCESLEVWAKKTRTNFDILLKEATTTS
ncbi:MAG: hypothetical protein ACRC2T_18060 [Thermoguttaceae bacterium]